MVMLFDKVIVTCAARKQVLYPYETLADLSFLVNGGISAEQCIPADQPSIETVIDALPFGIPFNAVPFINGVKADANATWAPGDRIDFRDADAARTPGQLASDQDEEVSSPDIPSVAEDFQEHDGLTVDPEHLYRYLPGQVLHAGQHQGVPSPCLPGPHGRLCFSQHPH